MLSFALQKAFAVHSSMELCGFQTLLRQFVSFSEHPHLVSFLQNAQKEAQYIVVYDN